VSFADCPAGKCLGFAFMLPAGFQPLPYAMVDAQNGLSHCFLESAWMNDSLQQRTANGSPADPLCGAPRMQSSNDFCSDPQLSLTAADDAHITEAAPAENHGDEDLLLVDGGDVVRTLVGFDPDAIDSFVASHELTSATLVLTVAATDGTADETDLLEAAPLLSGFVEGGSGAGSSSASTGAGASDLGSALAVIRPGGRIPRLARRPGPQALLPGVTWSCATDANTANGQSGDCLDDWDTDGGDAGPSTAPLVSIGDVGDVLSWDVTDDVLAGVSSWLIKKRDEEDPTGVAFHSHEGATHLGDSGLAPRLILR